MTIPRKPIRGRPPSELFPSPFQCAGKMKMYPH